MCSKGNCLDCGRRAGNKARRDAIYRNNMRVARMREAQRNRKIREAEALIEYRKKQEQEQIEAARQAEEERELRMRVLREQELLAKTQRELLEKQLSPNSSETPA